MSNNGPTEKQEKYIEARIDGKTQEESKLIAGYSPKTDPSTIERPLVRQKITEILDAKGITDEALAAEYVAGLELSKENGSKDKNLNAHAQYLKQLGFLRGHAKQSPAVAVQINNTTGSSEQLDGGAVKELIRLLREELADRDSRTVHDANPGVIDAETCDRVVETPTKPQTISDRGQP